MKKSKKNMISETLLEFSIAGQYIKYNLLAAKELRVSFMMQIIGMMLNNCSFLLVWIFFFQAFGKINGWGTAEIIGLQGFISITYGIAFAFFSGAAELPNAVNNGVFDSVLLTPRNLYLRVMTLMTRVSALGDMLFGIIVVGAYVILAHLSLGQTLLLASLLIPSAIIIANLLLVAACISFFIPDASEFAKSIFETVIAPSLYPSGVYQGIIRFLFLFILPVLAMAGLPIEAVKELDVVKVGFVWLSALGWTLLGMLALYLGRRHYESGNLTGARV